MPPVDPRAAEIIATIVEFESSVAAAENALITRDWPQLDALLSDQHRLTHALTNLLEESRDARPQKFTDEVNRRLRGITGQRDHQMRRLTAFNHLVKQRLTLISRTRGMPRGNSEAHTEPRILDLLQ